MPEPTSTRPDLSADCSNLQQRNPEWDNVIRSCTTCDPQAHGFDSEGRTMRSRLLATAAAIALGTVGAIAPATSASASPTRSALLRLEHPPDRHHSGGLRFGDGTAIRTGPFLECTIVGRGYPGQGSDVHCAIRNPKGKIWAYVRNTSTGKAGWVRSDALRGGAYVPTC